jgi:hypothetical protein
MQSNYDPTVFDIGYWYVKGANKTEKKETHFVGEEKFTIEHVDKRNLKN